MDDAGVGALWNHSFHTHLSHLGPESCDFHTQRSSGLTVGNGCSLWVPDCSYSFPSSVPLGLRNSLLEGWNHWWPWCPCLLICQEILHFSGRTVLIWGFYIQSQESVRLRFMKARMDWFWMWVGLGLLTDMSLGFSTPFGLIVIITGIRKSHYWIRFSCSLLKNQYWSEANVSREENCFWSKCLQSGEMMKLGVPKTPSRVKEDQNKQCSLSLEWRTELHPIE